MAQANIEWLKSKVAAQAETPAHEAPVLTRRSIDARMSPLKVRHH